MLNLVGDASAHKGQSTSFEQCVIGVYGCYRTDSSYTTLTFAINRPATGVATYARLAHRLSLCRAPPGGKDGTIFPLERVYREW